MDSKVVNRAIRGHVWPLVKEAGFNSTTSRTAWRHSADKVDVVNFQSFNRYNADVLGVTTFSFAVNLGCYLLYVPPQRPPKKITDGQPYPAEYECHFRGSVRPTVFQARTNEGIWAIDQNGDNLAWCLNDVAKQLPHVLAWFDRLNDRNEVFRILLEDEEQTARLWGFGRRPSPIRSYLTGYVAMALGKNEIAEREFESAVASGCFTSLFSSAEGARYRAV
jgi:hypothetical protein